MTVGSGGLLSGDGGILDNGLVTIGSGGLVSPGNSTGTITARKGMTINGDFLAEINDNGDGTLVGGGDFDQIVIAGGDLRVGTNSRLLISFGPDVNFQDPYWDTLKEYKIVDVPAGLDHIVSFWNTSQIVVLNGPYAASQFNFRLSDNPGLFLTFTPVPEPGTWALVGLAILGAGVRRRRVA
jgi:hypothetical protein